MPLLENNFKNSSTPNPMELSTHLPFSKSFIDEKEQYRFKEWYPRMGGACSLNSLYPPVQSNAFNKHPQYHHTDTCTQQSFGRIHSNTFDVEHDAMKVNRIETLPDVILIEIFRWLHPIDRIHSISLVCKRWNRLLYKSNIWSFVRIILSSDSVIKYHSAKLFLAKISKHLQKLCLYVVKDENGNPTSNDIEDILPKILPKLVLLDIGYFPEMSSSLLNKLDSCMPNLQKLNMEHAFSVSSYEVIFCKRRFVNIRELILCGWGLTAHKIETLFHVKKQLEVLNADEASNTTGMHSRNWKGFDDIVLNSPLKRLYVRGYFRPSTLLNELQNFNNLTLLSFTYMGYMGPEDILPIKRLSFLEHLHLSGNYDDYSRMNSDCLRCIFDASTEQFETNDYNCTSDEQFPSKLKFLNVSDWLQLDDSVIAEIVLNCKQLRSLSIARCSSVTEHGLSLIVKYLRELRFLDINGLNDSIVPKMFDIELPTIFDIDFNDLPHLIYLSAHYDSLNLSPIFIKIKYFLQRLILCKPTLIISPSSKSFITYSMKNDEICLINNNSFSDNQSVINKITNELSSFDGFCCMSSIT